MKFYKVGGCVRDEIMGLTPKDIDYVVVGGSSKEMVDLGYKRVGKSFPVFLHSETDEEYALACKLEGGEVVFNNDATLVDDLYRRDLTINSIAIDEDGNYVDPIGGIEDIKNKKLRHNGESFVCDPLRVVRLARFYSELDGFHIDSETVDLCNDMSEKGFLKNLQPDRLYKEFAKGLLTSKPSVFINALNGLGALSIILPVISRMACIPQNINYHSEGCVYTHTMMVLDESAFLSKNMSESDKLSIRMAALFHDVGKTETPMSLLYAEDGTPIGKHHNHEDPKVVIPLLDEVAEVMKIPKDVFYNMKYTAINHLKVHKALEIRAGSFISMANEMSLKSLTNNGNDYSKFRNFLIACQADSVGRLILVNGEKIKPSYDYPQADRMLMYLTEYLNSEGELSEWIEKYKMKNETMPESAEISSVRNDIRSRNIAKLRKNLNKEII